MKKIKKRVEWGFLLVLVVDALIIALIVVMLASPADTEIEPFSPPETMREWLMINDERFPAMDSAEQERWIRIFNEYSYIKIEE